MWFMGELLVMRTEMSVAVLRYKPSLVFWSAASDSTITGYELNIKIVISMYNPGVQSFETKLSQQA